MGEKFDFIFFEIIGFVDSGLVVCELWVDDEFVEEDGVVLDFIVILVDVLNIEK